MKEQDDTQHGSAQLPAVVEGSRALAAEAAAPPELNPELVRKRLEERVDILRMALSRKVIGKKAFTLHKGSGGEVKPYFTGEAAKRISPIIGLYVEFDRDELGNMNFKRRDGKDDDADEPRYYEYEIAGRGWLVERPNWRVEEMGVCSTRDGFFRRGKPSKRVVLESVAEGNVKKKATLNLWARIAQTILGIKGLSKEEIEAAGFSFADSPVVEYGARGKGAPSGPRAPSAAPPPSGRRDIRVDIGEALMAMAGGDKAIASGFLADYTRFEDDSGKTVQGVESCKDPRFSPKWAYRVWKEKIEPEYEAWQKRQSAQAETFKPPGGGPYPDEPLPDDFGAADADGCPF